MRKPKIVLTAILAATAVVSCASTSSQATAAAVTGHAGYDRLS